MFGGRRILFGFAGYKAPLNFGPGPTVMTRFSQEFPKHKTGKGTDLIPYDQPLPEGLVRKTAASGIAGARENGVPSKLVRPDRPPAGGLGAGRSQDRTFPRMTK